MPRLIDQYVVAGPVSQDDDEVWDAARAEEVRRRARLAAERSAQLSARLQDLRAGTGATAETAERAIHAARLAADLALTGYQHAADALERAADGHEKAAQALARLAERAGAEREELLRRADEHRQQADRDREEAARDRRMATELHQPTLEPGA
jgi:hypothetical protein